MLLKITAAEALAQLEQFSAVVDVRSESEFALDHVPGALNWPVLNDAERIVVGTEYAQVSPFTAKKQGAALVARNIAAHIEREVMPLPKDWKPLVYCWRGGSRSGTRRSPTFLLSLSTNTGRAASKARSVSHTCESKVF